MIICMQDRLPSRHKTLKQCSMNIDATSLRHTDVHVTLLKR